jgi:hypothetical protein
MHCAGIHQVGKGHLVDAPQSLVIGMRYHLEYNRVIDRNEALHRVIDDLSYRIRHSLLAILLKLPPKAVGKSTD